MFDKIVYSQREGFRIPLMILAIAYVAVMGVLVVLRSIFVYFFTIFLAALEAEFTSDMILDITANLLVITAYSFIAVGAFLMKKTAKPYGIGWLCYAMQVLLGCVILPFFSDIYGEPEYQLYLLPTYILLALCAGAVGIMALLGRGNKIVMLAAVIVGAAAFVITLLTGDLTDIGTLGATIPYIGSPFYLTFLVISNTALFGGAALISLSYRSTYY